MPAQEERYEARHCIIGHVMEQNIFCQRTQVSHACSGGETRSSFSGHMMKQNIFCLRTQVSHACSGGEIRSTTLFLWSREGAEYILPEDKG
jgi:hypothetical protein